MYLTYLAPQSEEYPSKQWRKDNGRRDEKGPLQQQESTEHNDRRGDANVYGEEEL
jgi:hypothetical protein